MNCKAILVSCLLMISLTANAQVIQVKKNAAYELSFPMLDSTNWAAVKTGVSPADDAYYKDGAGAWTALAITDTAAEIGSTGLYEISLSAAEMNHDWIIVKFTAAGASQTTFVFQMYTNDLDSIDDAVWTVAARSITVLDEDSTTIDLNATYVGGVTTFDEDSTAIDINGTTLGTVSTVTNGVTVTTNNDKTGYGLASGAITATVIATDAITADKIAASAITASEAPNLDAAISTRSSHTPSDVWSFGTRTLSRIDEDETTLDLNGTTVGGLTTWDKAGYSISGTLTTLDGLNTQLSTTHGAGSWATATGFSTFNPASDKVYLGNGAHGGAAATLTLSDYSNFTGGSIPSVADIWAGLNAAQLAKFLTVDTGETTAVAGSVGKIAQGAAGGNVTVEAFTADALIQMATDDTGLSASTSGSVAWLAGKCGLVSHTITVNSPSGTTVEDAVVVATSDEAGLNVLDAQRTNGSGQCTLQVPAGTIYVWTYHPSHNFENVNPTEQVAQ